MKRVITLLLLSSVWLTSASLQGKKGCKGQVGLNLQDGGTGIYPLISVLVKICPGTNR
jgi:hypothetical protein